MRQIADRCGYSVTGVRRLLRRFELTLPPRAAESRAVVGDDRVVGELVRMYQQEGRSMAGIAQRYGRSPDWVKARLLAAGVAVRAAGRRALVDPDRLRALLDEGLRVAQIAERLGCSDTTVLTVMRDRGWTGPPRRPRGPTRDAPPLPTAVLRRLYVTEGCSVATVADALQSSPGRVRAALRAGMPGRRPG